VGTARLKRIFKRETDSHAVDLNAVENAKKKEPIEGDEDNDLLASICETSDERVAGSVPFCAFCFLHIGCMLTCTYK
jgi:hypothetical protein